MSAHEEKAARLQKLQALRTEGIDPYPSRSLRTHAIAAVLLGWDSLSSGEEAVTIAGRLRSKRAHGGLLFANLDDGSGTLQIALKRDAIGADVFGFFKKYFDIGDFVEATGTLFVTRVGERTVSVSRLSLLAKALLPLPDKWHGLTDTELRFRKRYLDILMNPEVKARLLLRTKIISALRTFFDSRGFIEVETPTLQPIYGGGFARPFVTHYNVLDTDFYLRISDEMYLKRLLVAGFERVYEITKVFRNEGLDHDHNPEFTMAEAQIAYQDYRFGMDLFEELVEFVARETIGGTEITHGEIAISLARPWKRLRLIEAVREIGGIDVSSWKTVSRARDALRPHLRNQQKQAELEEFHTIGELIAFAFEELVEDKLIQPTIICDYPIEVSPLAKKTSDPQFGERFEVFALGSEIGNNYSELNDPVDLEQRFILEKEKAAYGREETHQTDWAYLEAIKYGMPLACGLGIGVDRLIMLLTGTRNIKEVILFPTLRPNETV